MQLLNASARPPALAESAALRSQSAASCCVSPLPVTLPVDRDSVGAGAVRLSYWPGEAGLGRGGGGAQLTQRKRTAINRSLMDALSKNANNALNYF